MALFHHAEHETQKQYAHQVTDWEAKTTTYARTLDVLQAIEQNIAAPSTAAVTLHAGESAVHESAGELIEPHQQRGTYTGASQGVSFHVAANVNYRVGATRGHYQPGPEVQTPVDSGRVVVTSTRVLFVGSRLQREWLFAKMLTPQADASGQIVMLPVSNREKVSGIRSAAGIDWWITVGSLLARLGIDECIAGIQQTIAGNTRPEPPAAQ